MLGNLGFPEIMIILVIILLLFGAKRIPEIAGSMGKGIKEFKKNINEATRDIDTGPPRYDNRLNQSDIDRQPPMREGEQDARPQPKRLI
ncbi:MAG TPA: twin-arginine translocase TatA/TatE family subunit [Gemmatimonadaceae bacterium]|nr:twin-arginine translocase TatA/TatE family subunit [Gemmatimonadaceae bacterium]